ncbi:MAG TPA: glycosyltransferase family 39 protein [Verrucomicrobiae bacterium]|jgi:hypothetical protein|nr:glycosyltransferase family 39 protein [Verrucomicrobiae bacterium]
MQIQEIIQSTIHRLEVGGGARCLRVIALVVAVVMLAVLYDARAYRNLATPEAMDAAQLARNISEGKGFTTLFIRPFSLYLIKNHNAAKLGGSAPADLNPNDPNSSAQPKLDLARVKTAHPDIANAPAYPVVLAGLMKVLPFHYPVELKKPFWSDGGRFSRYQPDFEIALFNEILLLAVVVLTFLIARKLFDAAVAWLAALLTIGSELLWRFSVSGLSTMLLLVIFLGLVWCILKIEEAASAAQPNARRLLLWALAAGTLAGVGALTRYSFGWVIIPLAAFLILFGGQRRMLQTLAAVGAFTILLAPWVIRNFEVSGTPFGTAGYAIIENTYVFPQFQLERSTNPDLAKAFWQFMPYFEKLLSGARGILTDDLLKTGGWAGVLFFAGLFLNFRGTGAQRIRYFLLICLPVFIVAQSLGRTQLSDLSPEINSENLLVLLAPLIFIFGAGFFFTMLEQVALPLIQLRYAVIGSFIILCCLPMIAALLPPKISPVVYPPYYPPKIQEVAGYMNPGELMMSDVPWAVAWYGDRQCAWLTLDWQNEFDAIDKNIKPVQALYLTPQTMDGKFVSEWMEGSGRSWGGFLLGVLNDKRVPERFRLTKAPAGFFPEQLFLADSERWKTTR